jgi:hypothetical protein
MFHFDKIPNRTSKSNGCGTPASYSGSPDLVSSYGRSVLRVLVVFLGPSTQVPRWDPKLRYELFFLRPFQLINYSPTCELLL